tara:strand:+ start:6641 stop:6898 length:258 start_codon:yes stop_codon:yes gene_type:complete
LAKKEAIEVEGTVAESLRDATFRIDLANGHQVMAKISGRLRVNYIRILPGDRVLVELSPYDLTRGRVTYRFPSGGSRNASGPVRR